MSPQKVKPILRNIIIGLKRSSQNAENALYEKLITSLLLLLELRRQVAADIHIYFY